MNVRSSHMLIFVWSNDTMFSLLVDDFMKNRIQRSSFTSLSTTLRRLSFRMKRASTPTVFCLRAFITFFILKLWLNIKNNSDEVNILNSFEYINPFAAVFDINRILVSEPPSNIDEYHTKPHLLVSIFKYVFTQPLHLG